ncbi:MAG: hypothetical protein LIO45_04080 [Clostridiales bacterium]|nr:hypothetical protein [Clostridiales bacterium]
MLINLFKYEFNYSCLSFFLVYGVLILLCILTGASDQLFDDAGGDVSIVQVLLMVTVLFFFAVVLITTVLNIQRFYNGTFREEGYLLHTLPVRPWQILAGKCIPALVWTVVSGGVMVFSWLLLLLVSAGISGIDWSEVFDFLAELFSDGETVATVVKFGVMLLALLLAAILQVYASISLGQLLPAHRTVGMVAAWFGLSVVESWTATLTLRTTTAVATGIVYTRAGAVGYTVFFLVWSVVFWAVTQWVLTERLNLE